MEHRLGAPRYPKNLNTFVIPNDPNVRRSELVYKPSNQTLQLASENNRSVYAEVFIEHINLGTLLHLCVRVLAQAFGPKPLPFVAADSLLLQVHYDALDVNLPLEKCYNIDEERFWKRLVLAKHEDKTLAARTDVNWKNMGVTMKFAELVEECPAEYWPEDEMKALALKINEFVTEIRIKRLQSLALRSFEKFFHSESSSETDSENEDTSEEDSESLLSSSLGEEKIGEEDEVKEQTKSQLALEGDRKEQLKHERQMRREAKQKEHEARAVKKAKHEAKLAARLAAEEQPVQKKKNKKKPTDVFNMELTESESDGESKIVDKRNKALFLENLKKYHYPADDCHHIDLSFLQYLTNLQIICLEFWGPLQYRNYHKRHRNFSHKDIENLAIGIRHLPQLHTFRLRNSRMDCDKLFTLCYALGSITTLVTLDFGYNQLQDDCILAFERLFALTKSLRNLELESNYFGLEVLTQIGVSLQKYKTELSYLGLARNNITDEALHALVSRLIGTQQVAEINIKGAKFVTEVGLCCCIAKELLSQHKPLIKLDIGAIKTSELAAKEILKALSKNEKILGFNYYGCEMDEETEIDINVIMKRNQFIAENYYLGDPKVTNEEVEQWLNRTINPTFISVFAERAQYRECLANRSIGFIPSTLYSSVASSSRITLDMSKKHDKEYDISTKTEKFTYPANEFDEQEFLEHVAQPGPGERYYYLKNYKKTYAIKENIKNVSMI